MLASKKKESLRKYLRLFSWLLFLRLGIWGFFLGTRFLGFWGFGVLGLMTGYPHYFLNTKINWRMFWKIMKLWGTEKLDGRKVFWKNFEFWEDIFQKWVKKFRKNVENFKISEIFLPKLSKNDKKWQKMTEAQDFVDQFQKSMKQIWQSLPNC